MTNQDLVAFVEGEARVDSRKLAVELDVEHESVIRLVDRNYNDFSDFGILRFQIEEIKKRGQPLRFTFLNEDQCYFALTLVRNTKVSIVLKKKLVQEFGRLRREGSSGSTGTREKVYERQDFPVFQNDVLGFTQCMTAEDLYCKAHRVSFDTTIKEFCGLRNPAYIRQLTNLVFKIFTGFEVRDFRRGWGIAPGSRLRTRLFVDSNLRRAIDDVEVQVRAVIKEHEIGNFDEIYTLVGDVAQSISGHCRAHRISLGRSVPINLRIVA